MFFKAPSGLNGLYKANVQRVLCKVPIYTSNCVKCPDLHRKVMIDNSNGYQSISKKKSRWRLGSIMSVQKWESSFNF